jgi:ATP-dependent RNA circularization protein (DNA/RNA ligase family)
MLNFEQGNSLSDQQTSQIHRRRQQERMQKHMQKVGLVTSSFTALLKCEKIKTNHTVLFKKQHTIKRPGGSLLSERYNFLWCIFHIGEKHG